MFEHEEQQLREARLKMDDLPIPDVQLDDAIQQGFTIADSEWRVKRQKRRKSLWTIVVAAILLLAFVTSIRVSPAFAQAISSIPGMGKLVEYIQYDKGLQGIMDNEYYQSVHASQIKDDLTLTIDGVILDESGIVISYTLEAPYSIENLNYKDIKLYHNDREVTLGTTSYNNPNKQHENRKEDLIQIAFSDKQSFEGQEFVLELQLDNNTKETVFSLPFELPEKVKKAKVYTLNKEIEVDNQKMTIQDITIYPLRVAITIEFDDANNMEIFNFEDMRIEDDKGEVWSSIRNGMTVSGVGEEERTYYLQSNYFEKPGKLYFKMNKVQALPKDESYLLVDLEKQEVLKQPSAGTIEITEVTANRIEARFREEKNHMYSLFLDTINADGDAVETVSEGLRMSEGFVYSNITFKESQHKNPLRINFSAYPNYINGDISIELK